MPTPGDFIAKVSRPGWTPREIAAMDGGFQLLMGVYPKFAGWFLWKIPSFDSWMMMIGVAL